MTEFLNEALDDSYITPKGIIKIIKKVGISGSSNVYQVECSECSKDKELWGDIVLTSDKFRLKHGIYPCACAKRYDWTESQRVVLINRKCIDQNYQFLGWYGDYKKAFTKLILHCNKHNISWNTTTIDAFLNGGAGCPRCGRDVVEHARRYDVNKLIDELCNIGDDTGYTFVGWDGDKYTNSETKAIFHCQHHGNWCVTVTSFKHSMNRCPGCSSGGYNKTKQGSLYVVDFSINDIQYTKIGITNKENPWHRIRDYLSKSSIMSFQYFTFQDGNLPLDIETYMLKTGMFGKVVDSSIMTKGGFYETTLYKNHDMILKMINNILNKQNVKHTHRMGEL